MNGPCRSQAAACFVSVDVRQLAASERLASEDGVAGTLRPSQFPSRSWPYVAAQVCSPCSSGRNIRTALDIGERDWIKL